MVGNLVGERFGWPVGPADGSFATSGGLGSSDKPTFATIDGKVDGADKLEGENVDENDGEDVPILDGDVETSLSEKKLGSWLGLLAEQAQEHMH